MLRTAIRSLTDDMLSWQAYGGFSIDASVHIPARDLLGSNDSCAGYPPKGGWCPSSAFALERLEPIGYGATGGERIVYLLPHPALGGGTALSLTPLEFLERLALLIHPPRIRGGSMSIIAFVTDPTPVRSILTCLDLPSRLRSSLRVQLRRSSRSRPSMVRRRTLFTRRSGA